MSFAGKRVLALESRRASETAELIRRNGGDPVVVPSMQEAPLQANAAALAFADRLFAGEFDGIILLTATGTRYLNRLLDEQYGPGRFIDALRRVAVVARGPKPVAVCREWNVPVAAVAPPPNTWREILGIMRNRPERRLAVQLYGKPHPELEDGLRSQGADITPVPIYQWILPEPVQPLRETVHKLAEGQFPAVLFTTSQQVVHLFQIAAQDGFEAQVREALNRTIVASIGVTTSEMLAEYGLKPDMEPSQAKLGVFVREFALQLDELAARKEQGNACPAT